MRWLDDHFARLSALERDVMVWLAIARDALALEELRANDTHASPRKELLSALNALRRRSLIERGERGASFTLQPVVMEYISDRLVAPVSDEIIRRDFGLIAKYALMNGQSKDYIRDSQVRMIVQPLLTRLLAHFGDQTRLISHLRLLMQQLRALPPAAQGYAGGNLVNLLVCLQGHIRGWDLSHLALRQADLREVEAQDANLAGADVSESRFMEPLETIISIALSPDGTYLAVGSFSGQIRVRRLADGKPIWSAKQHSRMAWALAFSPDGAVLASGGAEKVIRLWRVMNAVEEDQGVILSGSTDHITSLAFRADGGMLASGHRNSEVRLWELASRQCLKALQHGASPVGALHFSTENETLVSSSNHQLLKWWDAASGCCLATVPEDNPGNWIKTVAFSPDGALLATGSDDRIVHVWRVGPAGQAEQVARCSGHAGQVWAVALSRDRRTLASSDDAGTVILWDTQTGTELRRLAADRPYERMNISGITGISAAQRAALQALGTIENPE